MRALLPLFIASICWAVSFPVMKAIIAYQTQVVPQASSWFISSWCLSLRFLLAAAILALVLVARRGWRGFTAREGEQALWLGLATGLGMLMQMDGVAYTEASTSAFITQGYAVFIPLWLALRWWRAPHVLIYVTLLLVMGGSGILAQLDPADLRLGRGEGETLLAALVFTAQILLVEHPRFVGNNPFRMSACAFAVTGLLMLPVALVTAPSMAALGLVYAAVAPLACLAALTLVCTLGGMLLMFAFQARVSATVAGITYCSEPVFTSLFVLFLPGLLSGWLGVDYKNEMVTARLLLGGSMITAAVVLIQFVPKSNARNQKTMR